MKKDEKWTKDKTMQAIKIFGGIGLISAFLIYIGYDMGKMDSKILDVIIETAKETKQTVTFVRKGAQIYIVPEVVNTI